MERTVPGNIKVRRQKPLPFIFQIGAEWITPEDSELGDGLEFYIQKAQLTGSLTLTNRGKDVEISDLG